MIVRKIEAKKQKQTLCRVAAYCRVSTDNHDQLESLETQKEHYESCIRAHADWECAAASYLLAAYSMNLAVALHSEIQVTNMDLAYFRYTLGIAFLAVVLLLH